MGEAARLTTAEVCELARYGVNTLWRRIGAGKMPAPIDRGKQSLFDREAVLKALGMMKHEQAPPAQPEPEWKVDPDAIREARARRLRDAKEARRRDVPGAVRTPAKAKALRLVADNAPSR